MVAEDRRSAGGRLLTRICSRRAAAMLARNTVVSCFVFLVGLGVLWLLAQAGWNKLVAAGLGFVAANTLHFLLGRSWIFRGSDRGLKAGYLLFLINAGVGFVLTIILYAAMLRYTAINYIVARAFVSIFAGLAVFLLNAVLNFRRL